MSMLELAGKHVRHIHRITYIYNFRDVSHVSMEGGDALALEKRIRAVHRQRSLAPLQELTEGGIPSPIGEARG